MNLSGHSSSAQIAAARPLFAVLPVGACEQHGPHLPVDTDAVVAGHVAHGVCGELGGLVLPTMPFGTSAEHRGLHGTVSLRPDTLARVVEDVAESCATWGLRRLVVLSGHGGNWVLRPAVRHVNATRPDLSVGLVPEAVVWGEGLGDDLHAGEGETSMMMHLDPSAVGRPPADEVPRFPREALDLLTMAQLTTNGVWGMPSAATAEAGTARLRAMVDRVASYLRETLLPLFDEREGQIR